MSLADFHLHSNRSAHSAVAVVLMRLCRTLNVQAVAVKVRLAVCSKYSWMWAICRGSLVAVEYISASSNQNTQSRWRSVGGLFVQSLPVLKLQHASHTGHRNRMQPTTWDYWPAAGECVVSTAMWKQSKIWELQEKERCSQTSFKH